MTRELTTLFAERAGDYRAGVHHCAPAALADLLATLLAGASGVVLPAGVPPEWTARLGRPTLAGDTLTAAELDAPGLAVLTGCVLAVAETGTLVLDGGAAQGRRLLTLIPDHHVCVVHATQIVADLPDLVRALPDPTRPLTLISGPSATSDIELSRVEGVHGPRRLDVVCLPPG
ncbi:LutC/YkgG family protein [Micromonospora rifamycinica]|uniref:L-lactate dehydrogenase complex protein LldG n=1 Tax=Micromonospora rifamycinica TaxID=291594 RepID=A0A120F7D5_9ACTN|nr:LUD domain-containing protein [Micromonospora rifamycinica]KWV30051.1 lactate utilization protein C [Micromonospora rifamycinica]SCG45633.1 L-lactate dehydrogenase complex protein LldG [Micromonospora rifamycinica]